VIVNHISIDQNLQVNKMLKQTKEEELMQISVHSLKFYSPANDKN